MRARAELLLDIFLRPRPDDMLLTLIEIAEFDKVIDIASIEISMGGVSLQES
jgi:hypothetical protein